ncbi:MAG: Peptidase [Acidimicrobiales bacterium]|nr:Peptidase [Acidimicrobiales bacterium]
MAHTHPWSRAGRTAIAAVALTGGLLAAVAGRPAAAQTPGARTDRFRRPSEAEASAWAEASVQAHPAAVHASGRDAFVVHSTSIDPDGSTHVHLDRTYAGLPVRGGDVIVHDGPGGVFRSATLTQPASLALDPTPTVSQAEAVRRAEATFRGVRQRSTPRLAIDQMGTAPALAWQVVVDGVAPDQSPSHLNVLIDAATGAVRRSWDTFMHDDSTGHGFQVGDVTVGATRSSAGYELKDATRGNGQTRDAQDQQSNSGIAISSGTAVFGDGMLTNRATVGVDAHYGIQQTWDYYKQTHGRNGIRNDGKGSTSYVHYGKDYANAGWDDGCFCMIYGDGAPGSKPVTEIDVAGHEMTHGVTSATANLTYSGESGGLNESTSDIFGTLVEFDAHDPVDKPDYLIGEKIDIHGNGTPLRWMDDPKKDGASASCWSSSVGGLDVHYSSGVGNHFAYLLAVGSGASPWGNSPTCGAPAVTGIGNAALGKIWYRALTTYMTSQTNYATARTASLSAAKDLDPTGAWCTAVNAAWAAVAVVGSDPGCPGGGGPGGGQSPTVTNPGPQTSTVGRPVRLQVSASDPQRDRLTYSATGLPSGLSVDAGTGAVSGTPSAAGRSNVTVTAADPAGNRGSAAFTWTVTGAGGSCVPKQVVANGGFEGGAAPWTASPGVLSSSTVTQPAHSGSHMAWLDGYGQAHTDTLSQRIALPAGCRSVRLQFFLHVSTQEVGPAKTDTLVVAVAGRQVATFSNLDAAAGYTARAVDVSAAAGQTVTVQFTGKEDMGQATDFVIDDVTVRVA